MCRDCGVLFQVDSLCKAATTINGGLSLIEDLLYAEYKVNKVFVLLIFYFFMIRNLFLGWKRTNFVIFFTKASSQKQVCQS